MASPRAAAPLGVSKIVSGGQTGADRAALDAALELGIAIGGWIPAGRRAEDGRIPERYAGLVETSSSAYAVRTERNVRDSDATVVVSFGPLAGGSALTAELAREHDKPLLVVDLGESSLEEAIEQLCAFVGREAPACLNVAGPRASHEPRIHASVVGVLRGAFGR